MRILVAIDGSEASANAVRFVAGLFGPMKGIDASITLYHVTEALPDALFASGIPQPLGSAYQQVIQDATVRRKSEGEQLLNEQAKRLASAGVPTDRIAKKLETSTARPEAGKVAAALSIIEEMNAGKYDVVCVGRRGAASALGSFPGSMAEKLLREARGKAVWVID